MRGGGGGTLIFSKAPAIFGGLKNLNFNIFRVFQKNETIFAYENFVGIFGVHHKIGPVLEVISIRVPTNYRK